MSRHGARCLARVAAGIALASSLGAPASGQTPDPEDTERKAPEVAPWIVSQEALSSVPARTDLFRAAEGIAWRPVDEASAGELVRGVSGWLEEALSPVLHDHECRRVLEARGMLPPDDLASRLAATVAPGRPVADPGGEPFVRLEPSMAGVSDQAREFLATTGMLPVEAALAGEWARAAGGRLTGPAPRDSLLRAVRAARLEGVARLAAIGAIVRGTGVEPVELGSALIGLDRETIGTPRPAEAPADPVSRALLQMYFEDGIRWAMFHYLAAGPAGVESALGRPATSPAALLRPGSRFDVPPGQPPGCQLGPRGAAALMTGDSDPAWLAGLVRDSFTLGEGGRLLAWLGFDDPASIAAPEKDLNESGWTTSRHGAVLIAARPAAGR